jgi:hypothetical protein
VLFADLLHSAVVGGAQNSPPRFSPAVDHSDGRLDEAALEELIVRAVLELTEQPELLASGSGQPDFVVAGHVAVHRLPLPAAGELGRRRGRDSVKHGEELTVDLAGTGVEEVEGG